MRLHLALVLLGLVFVGCAGSGRGGAPPTVPAGGPRPVPPPEDRPLGSDPGEIPPVEPRAEDLVPSPEPRYGGKIHFLVADATVREALVRSNLAEGMTPQGLLLSWRKPTERHPCWVFEINARWVWPDGRPVLAEQVLAVWQTRLATGVHDSSWLLHPLGLAGPADLARPPTPGRVRVEGRELQLCPEQPTPDLPQRLRHPALWIWRTEPLSGVPVGPGPFVRTTESRLDRNARFAGEGPFVEWVELLTAEGQPALPLRLGDAHAGVVFGRAAAELLAEPAPDLELARLPEWDRTYFLWANPAHRWVNDPPFRSWLGGAIDRDAMVDYLLDGRGERAYSLTAAGATAPVYPMRVDRPLSPLSEPRLELAYERADPYAETLARRIQAVMATQRVALTLRPDEREAIRRLLREGRSELALLAHRPGSEDPVLALAGSAWWLGPGAEDAWSALDAAAAIDPERAQERADAAWAAERALLLDARVIPLVRLEAWIARHRSLTGIAPGPDGVLRLEEAWWLP